MKKISKDQYLNKKNLSQEQKAMIKYNECQSIDELKTWYDRYNEKIPSSIVEQYLKEIKNDIDLYNNLQHQLNEEKIKEDDQDVNKISAIEFDIKQIYKKYF